MSLTDVVCRNSACPADKARVRLADSGGLYLEVSPNGSRRWFWKYRFAGKEKRLALGVYPAVSLKAARDAATEARKLLGAGDDPGALRKAPGRGHHRGAPGRRCGPAEIFSSHLLQWVRRPDYHSGLRYGEHPCSLRLVV